MSFYEVIYETGSNSVISADSDEEALRGIVEHQRRATNGEIGGPTGHPAERIKRVLKYQKHPADVTTDAVSADELLARAQDAIKQVTNEDGVVPLAEFQLELDKLNSPMVARADLTSPHDSQYKMNETDELDSSLWESPKKKKGEE